MRVAARGREGARIVPDRVEVLRERPAEGGLDQTFELEATSDGHAGRIPLPRPGRWNLVVTATVDGAAVRETFALRGT